MNNYPELLKKRLLETINEMAKKSDSFVKNPGKDCSRKRKLDFAEMIRFLLSMGGNSQLQLQSSIIYTYLQIFLRQIFSSV